jgi:hypothetical protein
MVFLKVAKNNITRLAGNHVFGSQADQQLIPVHLLLTSGECLKGGVVLGLTGKLFDLMAKPLAFIEFQGTDGTYQLVAKASIERVVPMEIPRTDQLSRRIAGDHTFDPHVILGVARDAGPEEISLAYRALARKYHPDHYAGLNAPREVIDYVSAMFRRITLAYSELKRPVSTIRAQPASSEPCEAAPGPP